MVDYLELEQRVNQFQRHALPGQPQSRHMGTYNLVQDLWSEVQRCRAEHQDKATADKVVPFRREGDHAMTPASADFSVKP